MKSGLQIGKYWVHMKFNRVLPEHREPFMRDTGIDNLVRIQMVSLVLIAFNILLLLKPGFLEVGPIFSILSPLVMNVIFIGFLVLMIAGSHIVLKNQDKAPVWLVRIPVIIFSICFLWWGCYIGSFNVFGVKPILYFMICLMVLFSVFILSAAEASGILVNGLLSLFWLDIVSSGDAHVTAWTITSLVLFTGVSFLISRIILSRRLSTYLNWENISSMNKKLKWEIKHHQQTLQELEVIRKDLDRQVNEKTRFLRETNQQLQVEIAEKNYADKVKSILYRISGFVNQNNSLTEIISCIHGQLGQILDVTNFMVGVYDAEHFEIEPVFQMNEQESFQRYRLGRTLTSYVIRNKKSLLVGKKEIRALVSQGEIEIAGTPADCWIGIPLMVDDRVVGIMMVQSYHPSITYDQSDLQLLAYAGEHLAFAIDRYEVQSKLIKAKEKAEESDRLKSAFLSNLSHEIRTPMNAIMGFSEMMAETDLSNQQRQHYSSRVMKNGQRLLNTMTKIIELAKLQDHQMSFDIHEISVSRVFNKIIEDASPIIDLSGKPGLEVRFVCDQEAQDRSFLADPVRFKQILICLTENAVKFTDKGFIEIGCKKHDQRQLMFWVRDTGTGMNSNELGHIFKWFTKGQNASEKNYQGTGLGLTLAKQIIEYMHGTIWVESELGKGSCFYFTLPEVLPESIPFIPKSRDHRGTQAAENSLHAV